MHENLLITVQGFLSHFQQQHLRRKEKPFCFVLGAGASKMSGIPTGADLAMEWLRDLHRDLDFEGRPLEAWATEPNLGIPGFDLKQVARFYSPLYEKRFRDSRESGYAHLEQVMDDKVPSYGYAVLAYLLSETHHKIVITTNFDNLVADALSIHSTVFPLVVGHDSLVDYARVDLRRPLIAKVHGGLGFAPKSTPGDLQALSKGWQDALGEIFRRCSPIVIGYDGNDGSLMDFLEGMPQQSIDGLRWCFYDPDGGGHASLDRVPERIRNFVASQRGRLVPIPGFDEIMLLLQQNIGPDVRMPNLRSRMEDRARRRHELFEKQEGELNERVSRKKQATQPASENASEGGVDDLLRHAMTQLAEANKDKPWWQWQNEVDAESLIDKKDEIYTRGIEALPNNPNIIGNYANFLRTERKDMEKAESYYTRAIEADPKNAIQLGNYAQLCFQSGRREQGLQLLARADELRPLPASLEIEMAFYRLAHDFQAWPRLLTQVADLLAAGARSPGWNLDGDVAVAREAGHPNPNLLSALAAVISRGQSPASLACYPEWPQPGQAPA